MATEAPLPEAPAAESPAAVTETTSATRIIPVAEQSYLEFLILHPPTDNDKPDVAHSDYLRSKLDNITSLLSSEDDITAPEITPEQIAERQKEGLDEEIEKPQFEDWSYLDYLALATEPKGENPYLTYLTVQEKYLNKLLTKNVTPVIAEIADISESNPLPDTKERNLLTKRLILAVTGIFLIATGALVAHRFLFVESQINEATRAMQRELTRPALTAPLPDATHAHINTPMPTQPDTAPPTLTGSGEGGKDNLIYIPLNENSPDWNKDSTPFDAFGLRPGDGGSATLLSNGETILTKADAVGIPGKEDHQTTPLGIVVYRNFQGQNSWLFLPISADMQEGFEEVSVTKDKNNGAPNAAIAYKLNGEQKIARYNSSQFIKVVSGGEKWEKLQTENPALAEWVKALKSAAEKNTLYYPYGVDSGPAKIKIPGT